MSVTGIEGRDGAFTAFLGERELRLRLDIAALTRLEDRLRCGVFALHGRMVRAECKVADIVETLRQALLGGGTAPDEAERLIRAYVAPPLVPLVTAYELAIRALNAAILAPEGESLGKAEAGAAADATASPSPTSTAPARRSASRRRTSAR